MNRPQHIGLPVRITAQATRVTKFLGATPGSNGVLARIQGMLSDPAVQRIADAATSFTTVLDAAVEKPGRYTLAKAALGAAKIAIALAEIDPDSCFDGDEWAVPYPPEFNQTIIDVLRSSTACRSQTTTRVGARVISTSIDGCMVSWVESQSLFGTRLNEQVYVETKRLDQARAAIRQALWTHYRDKSIVFRRRRRDAMSDNFCFTFEEDEDVKPLQSGYARQMAAYLKRALDGGVTRSLLLYGEPGTGKSCLARAVIDILGLRCLRLRVEDLAYLKNSTLTDAVKIFAPDAVIIDDLDRLPRGSTNHLYEMLTFLKRNVKLVFGTVNNKRKVPAALRRPGRFDERRKIDVIDHDVVRKLLGPEFESDFDLVKNWPIVYVEEYANRRRFMAPEELAETVRELQECMRELKCEANDDSRGQRLIHCDDDDDEGCDDADLFVLPDDAEEPQLVGELVA